MTTTASVTTLAEIAALVGDVARANILTALMDGRALTAGELGRHAAVSASTASGHLAKLLDGQLVAVEKQGRHRYYRLARPEIAAAIEALMAVSIDGPARHRPTGPKDEAMRAARSCYDHLAGRIAVRIAQSLNETGRVVLSDGVGIVTDDGRRFLCDFGIDVDRLDNPKRPLCRTCMDWSERRPHLAGRLGAAILDRSLALDWVARMPGSRTLRITRAGERGFADSFRTGQDA